MAGDLSVHQKHAFYAYDSVHKREAGPSFEVLGGARENFIHLLAVCELVLDKKPEKPWAFNIEVCLSLDSL